MQCLNDSYQIKISKRESPEFPNIRCYVKFVLSSKQILLDMSNYVIRFG